MGGGSSKQSQSSTQETLQQSADGVVTGTVLQSEGALTVNQDFSAEVQKAFSDIVELASQSFNVAVDAGTLALDTVAQNNERTLNPEVSLVRDYLPVFMLAAAGIVLIALFRKK